MQLLGRRGAALTTLLVSVSSLALAAPNRSDAADAPPSTSLEAVVVTATRRSENLAKVPLSITALTTTEIVQEKITNVRDVLGRVPGTHFTPTKGESQTSVYIRGQAITNQSVGLDTPVAFFIDDIYYGTAASSSTDFYDVAQIAVLKGPQGTTFGRNVVGGAVQVTTQRPQMALNEGYINSTIESYYGFETWGYFNHSFSDTLAGRLSFSSRNRQGYSKNIKTGNDADSLHTLNGRGQLRWRPNDSLDANLSVSWVHSDGSAPIYDWLGTAASVVALKAATGDDPRKVSANVDQPAKRDIGQAVLNLNWDLGYGSLLSITGAHKMHAHYTMYADNVLPTTAYIGASESVNRERAFSQEFRFLSPADRPLAYIAGLYAEKSDEFLWLNMGYDVGGANLNNFVNTLIAGGLSRVDNNPLNPANYAPAALYGPNRLKPFAPGTTLFAPAFVSQDVKLTTLAGYLEGTWHVTDALSLTAGARYTYTHKSGTTTHSPGNAFYGTYGFTQDYSHSWYQLTPRIIAKLELGDWMAYASASNGVKSGGFSFTALTPQAVSDGLQPENSWSYEIGTKGALFDHRLYISLAAYDAITKNLQTKILDAGAFVEKNAGKIEVKGVELEADWRLVGGLTIGTRSAYTDGRFVEFKNCTSAGGDCSGNQLPLVPKWDTLVYANYSMALPQERGSILFKTSVRYANKVNLNSGGFSNDVVFARDLTLINGLIDLSAIYTPNQGSWSVQVWSKNVTDRLYAASGQNYYFFADTKAEALIPGKREQDAVFYGPPRTFGMTVDYRF